jgi:hypothetical protein
VRADVPVRWKTYWCRFANYLGSGSFMVRLPI